VVWTFVRRSLIQQTHFKFAYFMGLMGTVSTLVIYGMIARFGGAGAGTPTGSYVSFVISGLVMNTILGVALSGPYTGLMESFWNNRIEIILASPVRLQVFVTGVSVSSYPDTLIRVAIYVAGGSLFLGFSWPASPSVPLALLAAVMGMAACTGLGLAAASMVYLIDARGGQDPIRFVVEVIAGLMSGVYFPLQALPGGLQALAHFIPHTYAIDAFRRALFGTAAIPLLPIHERLGMSPVLLDLLVLALYAAVAIPVGWRLFARGIALARGDGRLSRWT
jgi:ABC-2 type transport system permease protein